MGKTIKRKEVQLTPTQIKNFANDGYLLLPNMLDSEIMEQAVKHCWNRLPSHFDPKSPKTWKGEVTDSCFTLGVKARAGVVKFQHKFKEFVDVLKLLPMTQVKDVASQLIAEDVVLDKPLVRGLYLVLPIPMYASFPSRGHIEAHAFQLGAIGYLNDVKVGEGAFSVWPGSHRLFYKAFQSKLGFVKSRIYERLVHHLNQYDPVQIPGMKGDVIFFHHRLFHAPSNNNGRKIRFAYLCDFRVKDYRTLCDQVPVDVWEDWPRLQEELRSCQMEGDVWPRLKTTVLRKAWVNLPKIRGLIYANIFNDAAKTRARMSREARSQSTVEDWSEKVSGQKPKVHSR
jgi:hypothetical protein